MQLNRQGLGSMERYPVAAVASQRFAAPAGR